MSTSDSAVSEVGDAALDIVQEVNIVDIVDADGGNAIQQPELVDTAVVQVNTVDIEIPTCSNATQPPRKSTERDKKYRQLVNKSKHKLLHGVFHNENYFMSKTRLQKKKMGFIKQKRDIAVGYKLIDASVLQEAMKNFCICKSCKKEELVIEEDYNARKGLAQSLVFKCKHCAAETTSYSSRKVSNGISAFDVNIRSTYASLPFGREGLAKFCSILNLPPPVLLDSYNKISNKLREKSEKLAESSMKESAERLSNITMEKYPEDISIKDDRTVLANVDVRVDGTWQKRGHASKHGVVFVISVVTGEVLDCSTKILFCSHCQIHQYDDRKSEKYPKWYEKHSPDCTINFEGSSGAMECVAGVELWLRFIEKKPAKVYNVCWRWR